VKEAAPDIRPLLKDADWEVRYFSVLALTQFDDRESGAAVKPLLQDPEPTIIVAAIAAHAAWSTDAGLDDLIPLLKHAGAEVRLAALVQLGAARSAKAGKGVVELLRDPERKVVLEAVRAAGSLALPDSVESLLGFIGTDDAELKAAALESLRSAGKPDKHLPC